MKKFILGIIFGCALITILFLQAFAAPIDSIEIKDGVTTINGQLPQAGAHQLVSIEVLKPGKSIESIDYSNPLLALDILNCLEQTETDADGNYKFSYGMDGDSGSYLVKVSWYALDTPQTKSFIYFSPLDIIKLVAKISATTDTAQMRGILEDNAQMLGLELTKYNAISEQGKNLVAFAIGQHNNFDNIGSIVDYFNSAVIVQELNAVVDDAGYKAMLEQDRGILGIGNINIYNRFSITMDTQSISRVHQRILAKNIFDPQVYKNTFEDMVIATALERANGWGDVYGILSGHNDILMLDFTEYNKLNEKPDVDKQLVGKIFESREEIANAFNDAVQLSKANQTKVDSGNIRGNSGSSGGSTSSIAAAVPLVDQQIKQNDGQFQDLSTVPWAVESIRWLAYKGILNGKENGLFKPDDEITRDEFTKILVSAFGVVDDTATASFKDADNNHWSYKYIASASKIGLVKGDSDGNFGLGKNITRQEMTVLAYRIATIKDIKLPNKFPEMLFADKSEIADYASQSISVMQQAGIVGGVGSGRFAPNEGATRAQAAKIVFELLGGNSL